MSASPGPGSSEPTDSSTDGQPRQPGAQRHRAPAADPAHDGHEQRRGDHAADRQERRVQPDERLGQPHLQADERQHRAGGEDEPAPGDDRRCSRRR